MLLNSSKIELRFKSDYSKILVIEDDLDMQEMMVSFLQKNGYMVFSAKNSTELAGTMKSQNIDLLLLDAMLGDDNGIDL